MKKLVTVFLMILVSAGIVAFSTDIRKRALQSVAAGEKVEKKGEPRQYRLLFKSDTRKKGDSSGLVIDKKKARLSTGLKGHKAPKSSVTTENIYASIVYPDVYWGLGKFNLDGTYSEICFSDPVKFTTFGIDGNYMYAFALEADFWGIYTAELQTIDLSTNEVIDRMDFLGSAEDFNTFIQGGCFVHEENAFYGFAAGGWYKFDMSSKQAIRLAGVDEDDFIESMCYNLNTKQIVGMYPSGEAVVINKDNGTHTYLFSTDIDSEYPAGFSYDITSDSYIWNPSDDFVSALYSLNPQTGAESLICELELVDGDNAIETNCLFVNEGMKIDSEAPKTPEFVSAAFPNGSLTGDVTFRMPAQLNSGSAISGQMDYVITANDKEVKRGQAAAGAQVTAHVGENVITDNGAVLFACIASIGEHESRMCTQSLFIGNDTPVAPANIRLTPATVSWDAVTTGVHGGYVDASKVRYTVRLNDEVIAENISATSCPTGLSSDELIKYYVAYVTAECNGQTSAEANSNDMVSGQPYDGSYSLTPTAAEANLFTVINANNDDKYWTYLPDEEVFEYRHSYYVDANDWLILPPVKVTDTSCLQKFAMRYWCGANYTERFEVYLGKSNTVEAMTTQLVPATDVTVLKPNAKLLNTYFDIQEEGVYYIGIKCVSSKDAFWFYCNDFEFCPSSASKGGPEAVSDIAVTPAGNGVLEATVSFRMPEKNLDGENLTGNMTAVVKSAVEEKSVTGAPGSAQTVTIKTEQGQNDITVQARYNDLGGLIETVSVYTGVDIPGAPENLRVTLDETNYKGTMYWDAPTVGANGGYVSNKGITYYLCQPSETIFGTQWYITQEIGTDVTQFSFRVPEETPQEIYTFGVIAANVAGQGNTISVCKFNVGKPYTLPATDVMSDGGFTYAPLLVGTPEEAPVDAEWLLGDPSSFGEEYANAHNGALIGKSLTPTTGYVELPKFATTDMEAVAFIPNVYVGSCENIRVTATGFGIGETEVFNTSTATGLTQGSYNDIRIDLPAAFQNCGWVQLKMYITFSEEKPYFIMGSYKMRNMVAHDLEVKVKGTVKAFIEEKATYDVTVTNIGTDPTVFTGYTATITNKEGAVIYENECTDNTTLDPDATLTRTFEFTPVLENVGDATLEIRLRQADDVALNDKATLDFSISKGKAVVVDNLKATLDRNKVELDWREPGIPGGYESFEDMTPFTLSANQIGEFTQVKKDDVYAYTWASAEQEPLKSLINEVAGKSGFNVFNGPQLNKVFGDDGLYPAADGEQFLIAFCPSRQPDNSLPAADDWLISPQLEAGSRFSFNIRPLTNEYGRESIELWYATEDTTDPAKFVRLKDLKIGSENAKDNPVWETIDETLPADGVRFAIHYTSRDIFGICVDAIHFVPVGGLLSIKRYDVFRAFEGSETFEAIGTATGLTYEDTLTESGLYSYCLIPVLSDDSMGLKSNIASVTYNANGIAQLVLNPNIYAEKGHILIKGLEGNRYIVTAADGRNMAEGTAGPTERIPVAAGIYVVTAGTNTVKIIVR